MLDQKVLITGASGFIGSHLTQGLLFNNICTLGAYLHRRPRSKPNFFSTRADLRNSDFDQGTLEGVGAAVHLAWHSQDVDTKPHVNQDITKRLLRELEKNKVKKVIYLSALGASQTSESSFLREKYECERLVLNSRIQEKIIIRSTIVYSGSVEEDVFLQYILKQLQIPWFYVVSNAKATIAPIHVGDLSAFLIAVISQKMNVGSNIIELAGDEQFSVEELYKSVAKRFVPGTKIALRGKLFESLFKAFIKKSTEASKKEDRTSDLMALYESPSQEFITNNPLADFLPKNTKGFEKSLSRIK